MSKIILSIVGVLAVLWVALFVSERQVLIWETAGFAFEECLRESKRESSVTPYHCFSDAREHQWECTYFNGRRVTRTHLDPIEYGSCPNFRKNR